MHFFYPIWFLAIAAVVIPVLIHLWNIRPGKTLKVGSVALMSAASRKISRSFKLLDILLLMLRCLMLVLLALMLTAPFWLNTNTNKVKGWVIVPRPIFKQTYMKFKKPVDSLLNAGYELHIFETGFGHVTLPEFLKDSLNLADAKSDSTSNYWETVSQLNSKLPTDLPVWLFTDNLMKHFAGNKPTANILIKWQTYQPADSASEWIEKAWFTNKGDIKLLKGQSNAGGINYHINSVQPGQNNVLFAVAVDNAGAKVSIKGIDSAPVIADTSVYRIAIIADQGQPDAAYLNAALKAIDPLINRKVEINNYLNGDHLKQKQDWIFWLSQKAVETRTSKLTSNLFVERQGKVQNIDSWIASGNGFGVGNHSDLISLSKIILSGHSDVTRLWHDGYGHPVLTLDKKGTVNVYNFYSRFDPAWNDLVWNDQFPQMLLNLVTAVQPSTKSMMNDKRLMDKRQMMPLLVNKKLHNQASFTGNIDFTHQIWIILVLLFIAERWLAHRKTQQTNG